MAPTKLSHSRTLTVIGTVFATMFVGFGANALVQPASALSFFELAVPSAGAAKNVVEALLVVYGVRDIFMGLAMYAAAYCGDRRSLGWMLVMGSGVALADGYVCQAYAGTGEWSHWGYAPMLTVVGSLLLGVLDGGA